MNETKVTITAPTNPAHLPAMHLHNVHPHNVYLHNMHNAHLPAMHNVHMTNQETTVVALFMKDFSSQTHKDLPSLRF